MLKDKLVSLVSLRKKFRESFNSERMIFSPDLPIPEVFAFAFNTLLNDMIMMSTDFKQEILKAQKNLFQKCVEALENNDHESKPEVKGNKLNNYNFE